MTSAFPSCALALASHVRACEADGQVVLLDLKHNRYLAVSQAAGQALATHVHEWPAVPGPAIARADPCEVDRLAHQLLVQGLLDKTSSARRSSSSSSSVACAAASLDYGDDWNNKAIGAGAIARFLISTARAAWWLRCRSLNAIAMHLTAQRERHGSPDTRCVELMKTSAALFERMRPLVFTSREKCLYDSLALMAFLASEGLFPHWVIGVKTGPFGAHSWVQSGVTVLNDQHEFVRRFQPILVV